MKTPDFEEERKHLDATAAGKRDGVYGFIHHLKAIFPVLGFTKAPALNMLGQSAETKQQSHSWFQRQL